MACGAHLAWQRHNKRPQEFMHYSAQEKAFCIASDELQSEVDRKLTKI